MNQQCGFGQVFGIWDCVKLRRHGRDSVEGAVLERLGSWEQCGNKNIARVVDNSKRLDLDGFSPGLSLTAAVAMISSLTVSGSNMIFGSN